MKNDNYIMVQGWMVNQLKLKGNELLLFAVIYGFSQDGKSQYKGSLNYISKALGLTKNTVISQLKKLLKKDLIIKYIDETGNRFSQNKDKVREYLGSAEIAPLGSAEIAPLGSAEIAPNIYNNKYINSNKGKFAEISENIVLIEKIARDQKVKVITVKNKINDFIDHSASIDNYYNNRKELFQHFGNWMRKQKLSDLDLEIEFNSFMQMFNQVSRSEFVGTKEIKDLFVQAINNGFTGKQMLTAIRNLYSTNNKWHKDNGYVFSTPEHLLKDENLNKYLNADY